MENLCCNKMSSFTNSSNSKLDSKLDSTKFATRFCLVKKSKKVKYVDLYSASSRSASDVLPLPVS